MTTGGLDRDLEAVVSAWRLLHAPATTARMAEIGGARVTEVGASSGPGPSHARSVARRHAKPRPELKS